MERLALVAIAPRLMSLEKVALYLGFSPWTVRDLDAGLACCRGCASLRETIVNYGCYSFREDLDRVIGGPWWV